MAFLSSDQLNSPMLFGAVAPKTAEMLAEGGDALTKRIEAQNQQFDAQLKAPQIGEHYANALGRIGSGDLTGFADLGKVNALAAGNPILRDMFKDADQMATGLYRSYMDKEAQAARFAQEQAMYDKRQETANQRYSDQFERQIEREDQQAYRAEMSQRNQAIRAIDDDVRRKNEEIKERNANEYKVQKAEEADGREYTPNIVKEIDASTMYPPMPVAPRPRATVPKINRAGGSGGGGSGMSSANAGRNIADDGLPLRDPNILEGNPLMAGGTGGAAPMEGLPPLTDPRIQNGGQQVGGGIDSAPIAQIAAPLPAMGGGVTGGDRAAQAAAAAAPKEMPVGAPPTSPTPEDVAAMEKAGAPIGNMGEAIVNESVPVDSSKPRPLAIRKDGEIYQSPFGIMDWNIKNPGAGTGKKRAKVSMELQTNSGKYVHTIDDGGESGDKELDEKRKNARDLAETIGKLNGLDYKFGTAASMGWLRGRKINVEQRGDTYHATMDGKPLVVSNPAFEKDPTQDQTIDSSIVSKDVYELWQKANGLKALVGKDLTITFNPPFEDVQKVRALDIRDIKSGKFTLEEVNKGRTEGKIKGKPLTQEEVDRAVVAEGPKPAAPPTPEVEKQLAREGIVSPERVSEREVAKKEVERANAPETAKALETSLQKAKDELWNSQQDYAVNPTQEKFEIVKKLKEKLNQASDDYARNLKMRGVGRFTIPMR